MKQVFALSMGIVMTVVGLLIGVGITSTTYNVVNTTAPSTTLNTVNTSVGNALTTFAGFLPVLVIAGIGGIALFYLIFYLGRQSGY